MGIKPKNCKLRDGGRSELGLVADPKKRGRAAGPRLPDGLVQGGKRSKAGWAAKRGGGDGPAG